MTPRKAPPPWRSGYCNPSYFPLTRPDYARSHGRCTGYHPDGDRPCVCTCHQPYPDLGTGGPTDPTDLPVPSFDRVTDTAPGDPLAGLTLTQAVELLYAAAVKLNETAVYDTVRTHDADTSLRLLARLRDALRKAHDADDALVKNAYAKGRGERVIDGLGVVNVSRTQDRKSWDERGIAQGILDAHLSGSSGEVPEPWTVVEWLLDVLHVDYARLGALRALGLDPDDYSEKLPGRPTVRLPGARW